MIVEYIRYRIREDRAPTFLEAHRKAGSLLRAQYIRYELSLCSEERELYSLRIEWKSTSQQRRFRESENGSAFLTALRAFRANIEEQRFWEPTAVRSPRTGGLGIDARLGFPPAEKAPWGGLHAWILEHLQDRITVDGMAEQVNMSPRNFARVFPRVIGVTPGRFLEQIRVAAAQADLQDRSNSLDQVAFARGFGSASTLRRAFLRTLGIGPSEYRDEVFKSQRTAARPNADPETQGYFTSPLAPFAIQLRPGEEAPERV
jgi:AraC-like DNA-binding protein